MLKCACGQEFDPWDHEACPKCGEIQDLDLARGAVQLVCRCGHVAHRPEGVSWQCPVCKSILGPTTPSVVLPNVADEDGAKRRQTQTWLAELRIRHAAYIVAARGMWSLVIGFALYV